MALLALPALAQAQAPRAELEPFGHGCTVQEGVRFCPTVELSERIPSFDGVPLDADVTLPGQGAGPFPTIVIMHGWGSDKTVTESATAAGDGNQTFDYNNVYYAQHGYAVLNYTARGWGRSCGTDDLFPVEQSLRLYEQVRSLKGYAALLLGDVGHPPASNKQDTDRAFNEAGAQFFAAKLEHEGKPPINHSVTAYTQTCPTSQPSGGPYRAKTWAALHPRALTFGSAVAQTFTSAGASPTIAAEFDPIAEYVQEAGEAVCQETKSELEPNAATYTMTSPGFLMLGLPTITAHVATTGAYGQIDARLWDVLPSGEQRLITRGVYRLSENQVGSVAFQMHGNGYEFAQGDTVKLELLGRDAPYYRASNTLFTVEATDVSVRLPTR